MAIKTIDNRFHFVSPDFGEHISPSIDIVIVKKNIDHAHIQNHISHLLHSVSGSDFFTHSTHPYTMIIKLHRCMLRNSFGNISPLHSLFDHRCHISGSLRERAVFRHPPGKSLDHRLGLFMDFLVCGRR